MNIRAITGFLDPGWPIEPRRVGGLAACLAALRDSLEEAGYQVQTLRLATPPPSEMNTAVRPADRPEMASKLEAECFVHGVDYACLGPALPEDPEGYPVIPEILASTETIFTSGLYADLEGGLSLEAARASAQVIQEAAQISPDGFANLRFAALANVAPGSPFFPAAYHTGGGPALALATEAAEVAVDALREVPSVAVARRRLVSMIEAHAVALERIARRVGGQHEVRFLGLDFSLAPFPEDLRSVGTALEAFGAPSLGLAGSAAAVAFLADCLDDAQFTRTGFCGLILPVLEDSLLAARAAAGSLTVNDLMLYATLCGAGLDTIPLPGDTTAEAMTAVLVDLGALALRHGKPMTARLMPVPGKSAGEEIHFDFPYFADSRVMELKAEPLRGLLAGAATFHIGPLRP